MSNTITITTTISQEQHELAKKNGWGWAKLVKDGIAFNVKPDVLQERLTALEAEVEAQRKKIRTQQRLIPSWSIPK